MEVKINKEISNYKENFFFGLPLKECIFTALACISSLAVYLLLNKHIDNNILGILVLLAAVPFAFFGFCNYNQMSALQLFATMIRFFKTPKHLVFKSENYYYEMFKDEVKEVAVKTQRAKKAKRPVKTKTEKKVKVLREEKPKEVKAVKELKQYAVESIPHKAEIAQTQKEVIYKNEEVKPFEKEEYLPVIEVVPQIKTVSEEKKIKPQKEKDHTKFKKASRRFFGLLFDIVIWLIISLVLTYIVNKTNILNIIFK